MNNYKVDFDAAEWESPMPGVRHKALRHGSKSLRLVEYGSDMAPHWCEKCHVGMILEGRMEIEFDSCTQTFEAGDGVFIPGGTAHRHRGTALTEVVRAVFVEDA